MEQEQWWSFAADRRADGHFRIDRNIDEAKPIDEWVDPEIIQYYACPAHVFVRQHTDGSHQEQQSHHLNSVAAHPEKE